MKVLVDYSKYGCVPSWSDLPMSEYIIVGPGDHLQPAAERFRHNIAAWNLYWALAGRLDSNDEEAIKLQRLPNPADRLVEKALGYSFRLGPGLGSWTLSALMCGLPADEFMSRYFPAIAALLTLPIDRGHVFLE